MKVVKFQRKMEGSNKKKPEQKKNNNNNSNRKVQRGGVAVDDDEKVASDKKFGKKPVVIKKNEKNYGSINSEKQRREDAHKDRQQQKDKGRPPRQRSVFRLPNKPPFTAFFGGLSDKATKEEFEAWLPAELMEKKVDLRWKGEQAFVDFKDVDALSKSLKLNGKKFLGRVVRVNVAKPMKTGLVSAALGEKSRRRFKDHISVEEAKKLIAEGKLVSGAIRINPHNRKEGYATVDGFDNDVKFCSLVAQNRALEGDTVAIRINDKSMWIALDDAPVNEEEEESGSSLSDEESGEQEEDGDKNKSKKSNNNDNNNNNNTASPVAAALRPTGVVVCILQRSTSSKYVGWLRSCDDNTELDDRSEYAFFIPFSKKMHRMIVSLKTLSKEWRSGQKYATHLYLCEFVSWASNAMCPMGKLVKDYGEGGNLEVEKTILLEANDIDYDDTFSPEVNACLPTKDFKITEDEIRKRRDMRKVLVCSIDPATAKDLDDALSIVELENGNWEVGVHIADVTHFVKPKTALDEEARSRATSVYLVDQCIPMLPRILSEKLCSLNSGQDSLAFSAVFEMTSTGSIVKEWFGKTVIRNAMQMSYETAQAIIDDTATDDMFKIDKETSFTIDQVKRAIKDLNKLGHVLRQQRFEVGGSVQLQSVKLVFDLDEAGRPVGLRKYQQKPANELVEDFMLLANKRVAEFCLRRFPDGTLLRKHEKPGRKMKEFVSVCSKFGFKVDAETSRKFSDSLSSISDPDRPHVKTVIYYMALRAMQLAKYTNTDPSKPVEGYWHYALAYPTYTHFTSPIRRYADCMVHRILHAALTGQPAPETMDKLREISETCNERKSLADSASDRSDVVFLCHLLKDKPIVEMDGYVFRITAKGFDVMLPEYGIEDSVMLDRLGLVKESSFNESNYQLSVTFDSYNPDYFLHHPKQYTEGEDKRPLSLTIVMFQKVKVFCMIKDSKRELDMGLKVIIDETGLKK